MKAMEANGLKLFSVTSPEPKTEEIEDITAKTAELIKQQSMAVVYYDHQVSVGTFHNGNFTFYDDKSFEQKFVQRLRIFNNHEELHIWRSRGHFYGRLRQDNGGDSKVDVVEAWQILFGTKKEDLGGYTKISEERGTTLILPGDWHVDKKKQRVAIRTRNYIGETDTCQATYVDCRFVEFVQLPIANN